MFDLNKKLNEQISSHVNGGFLLLQWLLQVAFLLNINKMFNDFHQNMFRTH